MSRLHDRANIKEAWWNPAPGSYAGLDLAHSWSRVIYRVRQKFYPLRFSDNFSKTAENF